MFKSNIFGLWYVQCDACGLRGKHVDPLQADVLADVLEHEHYHDLGPGFLRAGRAYRILCNVCWTRWDFVRNVQRESVLL